MLAVVWCAEGCCRTVDHGSHRCFYGTLPGLSQPATHLNHIVAYSSTSTDVNGVVWARTAWTSSLAEREQTRGFLHDKQRISPTRDLKLTQRELACPARIISR